MDKKTEIKVWTPEAIKELLEKNDAAVARAILALYARQTADEQAEKVTAHSNGRGFNGVDAEILSDFAQKIQRGWTLSPKQLALARRKLPKYAKQLAEVAAEAQAPKCAQCKVAPAQSKNEYGDGLCDNCDNQNILAQIAAERAAENAWLIASEAGSPGDWAEDRRERELEAMEAERMEAAKARTAEFREWEMARAKGNARLGAWIRGEINLADPGPGDIELTGPEAYQVNSAELAEMAEADLAKAEWDRPGGAGDAWDAWQDAEQARRLAAEAGQGWQCPWEYSQEMMDDSVNPDWTKGLP